MECPATGGAAPQRRSGGQHVSDEDSVDLARDVAKPPEGYFDLGEMLKGLIRRNVPVKVCGTCKVRCGLHKGEPYFEGAQEARMTEPAQWIKEADRVVTF